MAQPSAQSLTPEAAWKLMEQDYLLRLSLQTRKFNEDYQKGLSALQAKAREIRNSRYFLPAFVEYSVKEASERAEWILNACREIWNIQGRSQSHAFYRAIFNGALVPLFAGRTSAAEGYLRLKADRDRTFRLDGTMLGHLKRESNRLASEWSTRLEVENRNAQYKLRSEAVFGIAPDTKPLHKPATAKHRLEREAVEKSSTTKQIEQEAERKRQRRLAGLALSAGTKTPYELAQFPNNRSGGRSAERFQHP